MMAQRKKQDGVYFEKGVSGSIQIAVPDKVAKGDKPDATDVFEKHKYLHWWFRPIPISHRKWLGWMCIITPHNVISTILTMLAAIGVVWLQEWFDMAPMGGDGFAYLFTALTFLMALYVPVKMQVVSTIRKHVNRIQQHISGIKKHRIDDIKGFLTTRNKIISVIRRFSQISTSVPVFHINESLGVPQANSSFASGGNSASKELVDLSSDHIESPMHKLGPEDSRNGLVADVMNDILALRPSYSLVYMETVMHIYNFVMMTVFYPILLRERMNSNWTWMPATSLLCFMSYTLTGLLFISDYEMRAWGISPLAY